MKRIILVHFVISIITSTITIAFAQNAQYIDSGRIKCFSLNVPTDGRTFNISSTSAVVYIPSDLNPNSEGVVYMANDKPTINGMHSPSISPIFTANYKEDERLEDAIVSYVNHPLIEQSRKIEAMTLVSHNGTNYILMSTSFSTRGKKTQPWGHPYNMILFFPIDNPSEMKLVNPSESNGIRSSHSLRNQIGNSIKTDEHPDGIPYFTIEGIAALPDNLLLFGIRKIGSHYKFANEYSPRIITTKYSFDDDDNFSIQDDFADAYIFSPLDIPEIRAHFESLGYQNISKEPMGISDLAYDKFNNQIYILTAFEHKDDGVQGDLGAYLWILPMESLATKEPPHVVTSNDGTPLLLEHKFEGVTVINENTVLLVADDDYAYWGGRQFNQTPYLLLHIHQNEK